MKYQQWIYVALLVASGGVVAETPESPLVDKRQENQEHRIQQGVESGSLTKKEAVVLKRGQKRVAKMEERAKADGKLTKKERARLHQAQNQQSRRIFKEKHDRQVAKPRDGG